MGVVVGNALLSRRIPVCIGGWRSVFFYGGGCLCGDLGVCCCYVCRLFVWLMSRVVWWCCCCCVCSLCMCLVSVVVCDCC